MIILAIESSCDETACAIVENGNHILSSVVASQDAVHASYGGVVPELASREHLHAITWVVKKALCESQLKLNDIDAIACTRGPGLSGSLLVGLSFAKALAYKTNKPFIGIHHIEGHLAAGFLSPLTFPCLGLVTSGGHTQLFILKSFGQYQKIGQSRDDAAGEAFDKAARLLNLGFPGGPMIEKAATSGNCNAVPFARAKLPNYEFSFSGLKTALLYHIKKNPPSGTKDVGDIAASFQEAIKDMLLEKTLKAAIDFQVKTVLVCGGVARNMRIRQAFIDTFQKQNIQIVFPDPILCTDNAAMIAIAAFYRLQSGFLNDLSLTALPNLSLAS